MRKINQVLIVDDSESMRFALHTTLTIAGYEVHKACNGLEALKLAEENTYDLVLTDINMPVMDGYQLIENLRKLRTYKFTPILTLTTLSDDLSKRKAKQFGATGWIVKPFSPENLTEISARLFKSKVA